MWQVDLTIYVCKNAEGKQIRFPSAEKFNSIFPQFSWWLLPPHGHAAHILLGSFLVVVRLMPHGDAFLLELPPAFSVDVLPHRGGGGHNETA